MLHYIPVPNCQYISTNQQGGVNHFSNVYLEKNKGGYIRPGCPDNEEDWHNKIKEGDLPYPDSRDWRTSMKYTGSLRVIRGDIFKLKILESCFFEGTVGGAYE